MSVTRAGDAVRRAGYRTACRNFRVPVAMALSKGPFRRVAPGRYTATGRPAPGPNSIAPVLERVLRGKVMSVREPADAVRTAGYRPTAQSLYGAVGNALATKPQFKRVARGWYTSATHPARRNSRPIPTGLGSLGPRPGSMVSVLLEVLDGRTMTVSEAVAALRKRRYRKSALARSLYGTVAGALAQSGRFRRVGRGRYTAR